MNTKHLGELNSSTFFCECQQGPADGCLGHHADRHTLKRSEDWQALPWVLAIFAIGIAVLMFGMYAAVNQ